MIGRVYLQLNSEPCAAPAYTYSKHTLVCWTYRPFEQLEHNTVVLSKGMFSLQSPDHAHNYLKTSSSTSIYEK